MASSTGIIKLRLPWGKMVLVSYDADLTLVQLADDAAREMCCPRGRLRLIREAEPSSTSSFAGETVWDGRSMKKSAALKGTKLANTRVTDGCIIAVEDVDEDDLGCQDEMVSKPMKKTKMMIFCDGD